MSDAAAPVAPTAAPEASSEAAPVVAKAPEAEPSFELEIDGKKTSLTHTQARTELQKSRAADKRLQEASESKKKLDALYAEFEADPEAAMRKAGKDPEKILAALLERKAKQALMTPEQIERAKEKEELDALKADKDKREKAEKQKADEELDQHNEEAMSQQLFDAANAYNLDATGETLEGLCDVALDLIDLIGPGITPDQVVQKYLQKEQDHLEARDRKLLPKLKGPRLLSYLKANVEALLKLPPNELLEALGPEGIKAVQDATLTRVQGSAAVKPRAAPVAAPPRNGASGRFMTEGEYNKRFPPR